MRRIVAVGTWGLLCLLWLAATRLPAQTRTVRLGLFDRQGEAEWLRLTLSQTDYAAGEYERLAGLAQGQGCAGSSPGALAVRFAERLRRGVSVVPCFSRLEASMARRVATLVGTEYRAAARIELVRTWSFGERALVHLRLYPVDGEPELRTVATWGAAGHHRASLLGAGQEPVLALLEYLAVELGRGRKALPGSEALPYRAVLLPTTSPGGPLEVAFRGHLYPPAQDWIDPASTPASGDELRFLHRVFQSVGDAAAFRGLWVSRVGARLDEVAAEDPRHLDSLMERHRVRGGIKHILTLYLGRRRAHYFLGQDRPAVPRVVFFEETGEGYGLTSLDDYMNVARFLTSTLWLDRVLELSN